MLNANESEEGITSARFVRFDFFHKSQYNQVCSYLSNKCGGQGEQYVDSHVISYTRRGRIFSYEGDENDATGSGTPSFSSLKIFNEK